MRVNLKPATRRPAATRAVSKARRRVNAAMVVISTMLAALAMMTSSATTRGALEAVGMSAAITTATLVSLWHLAAAGRRTRLAYCLCAVLVAAAIGTAVSTYMLSLMPTGIRAWGYTPPPSLNAVVIGTFVVTMASLPVAIAIAVLGLRPVNKSK